VAKAILFLLSDESAQITGQVLNLEARMPFMIAAFDKTSGTRGSVGSLRGDTD
jgi:hypothetical protein